MGNVKRKTDKDDTPKLAQMVAMKELKPIHILTPEHHEFRSLVKHRKSLDPRINKFKNTFCDRFVNHGITIDVGGKAWHAGRARIKTLESLTRSPE